MHHALLFVGTKLLAEFKRPKSMHLSSKDIFLLTLFYSSHFNPKVLRRVQAILEAQQMLEAAETPDDIDFFVAETYVAHKYFYTHVLTCTIQTTKQRTAAHREVSAGGNQRHVPIWHSSWL
jgi:hypothetical protein